MFSGYRSQDANETSSILILFDLHANTYKDIETTTLIQQASPIIPNKASPPVINMHSIPTLCKHTGFKALCPKLSSSGGVALV